MLQIKDLCVENEGQLILEKFSLKVKPGEIHAIMGPNGAGKSTLVKVLAGHPHYQVKEGEIWFRGKNVLNLTPEQRVHLGLFIGFQYPIEIAAVSNFHFLFSAYNAKRQAEGKESIAESDFEKLLEKKRGQLQLPMHFFERGLNADFSGGEKKRNEILQMHLLKPVCALLDEIDSGLDIDAMRIMGENIRSFLNKKRGLILITHYPRFLDFIHPQFVHVMVQGKLVESGGPSLALSLEKRGYANL